MNWEAWTTYSKTDDFGLPVSKNSESSKMVVTREGGLASCYLEGDGTLNLQCDAFRASQDLSRIVLVKSGGKK